MDPWNILWSTLECDSWDNEFKFCWDIELGSNIFPRFESPSRTDRSSTLCEAFLFRLDFLPLLPPVPIGLATAFDVDGFASGNHPFNMYKI